MAERRRPSERECGRAPQRCTRVRQEDGLGDVRLALRPCTDRITIAHPSVQAWRL
jgi:hypothetical protein